MPQLIKKLSTRAREALANTTGKSRSNTEVLRAFKRFRKVEEARLRMLHRLAAAAWRSAACARISSMPC